MTESELLFVSQTLLATAFYYGVAGGLVGCALPSVARFSVRLFRRAFQWR